MPLSTHSLHNRVRHWLFAFSTLARVSFVVTWQAPSVFILFEETGFGAEGITTFRTEEVTDMPGLPTSHHYLPLNWRFAILTPGTE